MTISEVIDNVHSESTVSKLLVHQDGSGTNYLVSPNGLEDSSSDAGVVFQSALDWFSSNRVGTLYLKTPATGSYHTSTEASANIDGLTVIGDSQDKCNINGSGLGASEWVFNLTGASSFAIFDKLKFTSGNTDSGAIRVSAASSTPAYAVLRDLHVVNCTDVAVDFNNLEDSWIIRGRYGNNDVSARLISPGGRLELDQATFKDSGTASVQFDCINFVANQCVFGSSTGTHVEQIGSNVEIVAFNDGWTESTVTTFDGDPNNNGNKTPQLFLTGGISLRSGNGNPFITGDVGTISIQGAEIRGDADAQSVEPLMDHGADYGHISGIRFAAGGSWGGNKPFRGFIPAAPGSELYNEFRRAIRSVPFELSSDALDPGVEAVLAYHNGDDGNPAGFYKSDPSNNQWVGPAFNDESNQVTISY